VAVTVSIPTILRTHTGGEKAVEADGSTLAEVIDDLDQKYAGLKARLVTNGSLHRFVNIYVNDEDVRFAGGLDAAVSDGDTVTILPAVAGGATILPAVGGGFTILPAVAGG
jgi:sulfur-carrier protein